MNNIIKIEYLPSYKELPELIFAKNGDSGFDLRAAFSASDVIFLYSGKTLIIPNGIKVELPEGFELQIRSRSGLAAKNQVIVLNAPGTIDNGYRGEIKTILTNLGEETFIIRRGDRIAQAIPVKLEKVTLQKIDKVNKTDRGDCGFGSTGKE